MSNLSILIVVHNEERQLKDCLETISFADELIIILDKCTDNSEKIARKFSNKIFSGSWNIEGDRRNFGISKCKSNWIFEIDADERVPKKLKSEILKIVKKSKSDWHMIGVNNYLGDKLIKFGWGAYIGKSAYAGLFRKKKKVWDRQRVHPKIKMLGNKGSRLKNKIDHYYCKSIFDLFNKLDSYSEARAKDLESNKNKETLLINIRRIFSRFWKAYFLRKGYKEKKLGFIIALVASLFPLISYLKFKIQKKNE